MSLWACADCHTLTSFTRSLRCSCGGILQLAQIEPMLPTSGTTYYLSYDDRRLTETPCPDCKRVFQHGPCKDPTRCRYRLLGQSEPKGAWATTNTRGPDEPL